MVLLRTLILGTVLGQLKDIRFTYFRYIEQGIRQLGVKGLPTGLLPLHLSPALHGRPHRLDCGGLEDLALSKGTDHVLTTRA